MQVVWFKRDLRVFDHQPLAAAAEAGDVLALYVIEPEYWKLPDTSMRQWMFLRECLEELQADLSQLGLSLYVTVGSVLKSLTELHHRYGIDRLLSHEETGNQWTYERDIAVREWTNSSGIEWLEVPQHGVIRRLNNRDGWAEAWEQQMHQPIVPLPDSCQSFTAVGMTGSVSIPPLPFVSMQNDCCPSRQTGGRSEGLKLLTSFLAERGEHYQKEMSSPVTAGQSCSRLSAHLAYGSVSMREVLQVKSAAQNMYRSLPASERGGWGKSLSSYSARLHWHCHFIQKLEDDPSHESEDVHTAYEGMRGETRNDKYLQVWAAGQTGYPFIDACMRSLIDSGWINFRMRAMLLSFASYQLWLHWREPGLHLARMFVDYEPGIHWNQVQMQSGTTGINTVRMYNPVKQSIDQDPDGVFIRQWVPELADVDIAHLHEPWKMTALEQQMCGCYIGQHYPEPIVDHIAAAKFAREKLREVRNAPGFQQESQVIQERHGSRKGNSQNKPTKSSPANKPPPSSPQLSLDLDN